MIHKPICKDAKIIHIYNSYEPIEKDSKIDIENLHLSERNFMSLSDKGYIKKSSSSFVFPFYQYDQENKLKLSGIYHHKINCMLDTQSQLFEKGYAGGLGILTEDINNTYVFICQHPIEALFHREMMIQNNQTVADITYICTGGNCDKIFERNLLKFIKHKEITALFIGLYNDANEKQIRQQILNFTNGIVFENQVCMPKHKNWQEDYLQGRIETIAIEKGLCKLDYVRTLDWNKSKDKLLLKMASKDAILEIRQAAHLRINKPVVSAKEQEL